MEKVPVSKRAGGRAPVLEWPDGPLSEAPQGAISGGGRFNPLACAALKGGRPGGAANVPPR